MKFAQIELKIIIIFPSKFNIIDNLKKVIKEKSFNFVNVTNKVKFRKNPSFA